MLPDRKNGGWSSIEISGGYGARIWVEIRQLLNGQLLVCFQGKPVARFKPLLAGPPAVGKLTPADPQPVKAANKPPKQTRQRSATRRPYKPPPDHPWRKPFIVQSRSNTFRG